MEWMIIIATAVISAFAGLVATLFLRPSNKKHLISVIVSLCCFLILSLISREFIFPKIKNWRLNKILLETPVYQFIKEGDPQTYERLQTAFSTSVRHHETRDQIVSQLRTIFLPTLPKYIPAASDESILRYMNVMVKEMEVLYAADPGLCHQFLFPQPNVYPDLSKYFSQELKKEDLEAVTELIKSAVRSPQAPPYDEGAKQLLRQVMRDLKAKHGEDVFLLNRGREPDVDKAKVCSVVISLYKKALELPPEESGRLLRYLLTSS